MINLEIPFLERYWKRSNFAILALLLLSALSLRIGHVHLVLNGHDLHDAPIHADARQYIKYGYNLVYHHSYSMDFPSQYPEPDSYRSPGYPLLIALSILLTRGTRFIPVTLYIQVVIGTITVLLTYLLAKRFMSARLALIPALLVGWSPHLITMSGYILSETLSAFLLTAALLLFSKATDCQSRYLFAISGMIFGLGYLTNETFMFLPIIVGSIYLFQAIRLSLGYRKILLSITVFLAVFLIFPSAWTARNVLSVPKGAPTGYNRAVQTMSHGAYPGFIHETLEKKYYPYQEDPLQPQFGTSVGDFGKILWQRAQQRPFRYLSWYLFEKPYHFWSWNILQGQGDVFVYPVKTSLYHESRLAEIKKEMMKYLHTGVLILVLLGFPALWAKRLYPMGDDGSLASPINLFSTCIYFTLLFALFAPWPRYSIMLRPELYICAVWSFGVYFSALKRKQSLG